MGLADIDTQNHSSLRGAVATLRRFVTQRRQSKAEERCDLCSAPIHLEHEHLLELATRNLVCSCEPCAILFGNQGVARFRRVPRRVSRLEGFQLDDLQWASLDVPIGLAFFFVDSLAGRPMAAFPSPAGATNSDVPADAWQHIQESNPVLAQFQPDVEALLVNRIKQARDHYLVPIDICYGLVGLVRVHWRGLSGGKRAWEEIDRFFARLAKRSRPLRRGAHA